jgi:hypothetical protein
LDGARISLAKFAAKTVIGSTGAGQYLRAYSPKSIGQPISLRLD